MPIRTSKWNDDTKRKKPDCMYGIGHDTKRHASVFQQAEGGQLRPAPPAKRATRAPAIAQSNNEEAPS